MLLSATWPMAEKQPDPTGLAAALAVFAAVMGGLAKAVTWLGGRRDRAEDRLDRQLDEREERLRHELDAVLQGMQVQLEGSRDHGTRMEQALAVLTIQHAETRKELDLANRENLKLLHEQGEIRNRVTQLEAEATIAAELADGRRELLDMVTEERNRLRDQVNVQTERMSVMEKALAEAVHGAHEAARVPELEAQVAKLRAELDARPPLWVSPEEKTRDAS